LVGVSLSLVLAGCFVSGEFVSETICEEEFSFSVLLELWQPETDDITKRQDNVTVIIFFILFISINLHFCCTLFKTFLVL